MEAKTTTEVDSTKERTYNMLKPEVAQRCLIGKVIQRYEQKGFKLVGLKFLHPSFE